MEILFNDNDKDTKMDKLWLNSDQKITKNWEILKIIKI